MKLLNDIVKDRADYADRLQQIAEKADAWLEAISKEKRLGLKPIDQMLNEIDPYNTWGKKSIGSDVDDSVEFTPSSAPIEKPVQGPQADRAVMRIHLIYNPASGEVQKVIKTPMRSRPPAEYMEANADQVSGALKHLEKLNPHLADLLVRGKMSVWIPRKEAAVEPSSVKHLGLQTNAPGQDKNVRNLSPTDLAKAHHAASRMSLAK